MSIVTIVNGLLALLFLGLCGFLLARGTRKKRAAKPHGHASRKAHAAPTKGHDDHGAPAPSPSQAPGHPEGHGGGEGKSEHGSHAHHGHGKSPWGAIIPLLAGAVIAIYGLSYLRTHHWLAGIDLAPHFATRTRPIVAAVPSPAQAEEPVLASCPVLTDGASERCEAPRGCVVTTRMTEGLHIIWDGNFAQLADAGKVAYYYADEDGIERAAPEQWHGVHGTEEDLKRHKTRWVFSGPCDLAYEAG